MDRQGTREGDAEGHRYRRAEKIANYVPFAIMILIIAIAIAVGVQQANYVQDQKEFAQATRENTFVTRASQYRACVKNGNEFREQVRQEFIDLKADVLIPVFSKVASTIPVDAPSRTILDRSVQRMNRRINTIGQRIPNIHCLLVYPPLHGQVYPDFKDN